MRHKTQKFIWYFLLTASCCTIYIFTIHLHSNSSAFEIGNVGVKKDWHNYEAIKADELRTGPGEQGLPVDLNTDEGYIDNGFNLLASKMISLDRSLPDIRHKNCKVRKYLANLPTVSIVIPFHNEAWSTLFRSLHSIVNRSPVDLLHEIVLVDDASNRDFLGLALDQELLKYPKVKLIRLPDREGLIRARIAGAKHATGEVIIILDSHIEVTHNWLPPLLEPIALDRKTISCPLIDVIDHKNFKYESQHGDAMRGAFDWNLLYKRIPIPPEKQQKDPTDPYEDPVMAGGLFAIDRQYFKQLGFYDSGLEIWGGEQYELSFKTWMCGGRIVDVPCSRIGHIYHLFLPYSIPPQINFNKNFKRVAEVWMDEYKEYLYMKRSFIRDLDVGDLEDQHRLRRDLNCKSFHWYMTEVAPDIVKYFPLVIPDPAAWGKIKNAHSGLCIDAMYQDQGKPLHLLSCDSTSSNEQEFMLTWREEIQSGTNKDNNRGACIDFTDSNEPVAIWPCHGQFGNQLWKYLHSTMQLVHGPSGLCLTAEDERVIVKDCDQNNYKQLWMWENFDADKLDYYNSKLNVHVDPFLYKTPSR